MKHVSFFLVLFAILMVGQGCPSSNRSNQPADPESRATKEQVIIEENGQILGDPNADMIATPQNLPKEEATMGAPRFMGTVLAGASSPLLEYNQADFDKAVASGKLVVLYFYANWCPICRAEFPKMQDAFDELSRGDVVGFRVSFNDNETLKEEQALAREHGVAYQHTKVFINNGERLLKSPEGWEKDRYLVEIAKF